MITDTMTRPRRRGPGGARRLPGATRREEWGERRPRWRDMPEADYARIDGSVQSRCVYIYYI